jgi:hypothetical protein
MGAPFPLIYLVPLRGDGNDYKCPTQTIFQVSATTRIIICIPAIHIRYGE